MVITFFHWENVIKNVMNMKRLYFVLAAAVKLTLKTREAPTWPAKVIYDLIIRNMLDARLKRQFECVNALKKIRGLIFITVLKMN